MTMKIMKGILARMKSNAQNVLCVLAILIAACNASCDKQAAPSKAFPPSQKEGQAQIDSPANAHKTDVKANSPDPRAALKRVSDASINWGDTEAEATKRQLPELIDLHKSVSATPTYENAVVSAGLELKLCNIIVPGLIYGCLTPIEARSWLASIAAGRFSNASLITMLAEKGGGSDQTRLLIAELRSGRPVNLIEASNALLRERGADFLAGPAPDKIEELIDHPDPARTFQYHAMAALKLEVAGVIAAYASAGGNLNADDATITAGLLDKVPSLVNAPGLITHRSTSVSDVVYYMRKWRNDTFAR